MKAFWNESQLKMIFDFTRKHFEIIKIFNVITGCIDIFFTIVHPVECLSAIQG